MIVVTGAKGIIGRAVVSQLLEEGSDVKQISRDNFDLSSGNRLTAFVSGYPEAIIHLAAAVPHSVHYPDTEDSADLTRKIDRCVFDAAVEWNCRVVYASTCSLYDKRSDETMFEDTPIHVRPDSPYMSAKNQGEVLFAKQASYAIMRVPAPIGPGLPTSVVAKRFFDLASSAQPIRLWGSGKREQNYVDVRDISDVLIKAAFSKANGVFNIAADSPTTMIELAKTVVKVVGSGSVELAGVPDPLEYEHTRYSNRRAQDLLGWRPKFSLEKSIQSMQEER